LTANLDEKEDLQEKAGNVDLSKLSSQRDEKILNYKLSKVLSEKIKVSIYY